MGTPTVAVRLLGPVEIDVDGTPVPLRARLPRHLLVALALQPDRVVGTDALLSALWDDDPPDSALGTLQSYVSTLRRAVGDRTREQPLIARRGDGYALAVPPEAVDSVRFEQLVAASRTAPPAEAERLLTEALALWRGPALADVAGEAFARAAAARLDELRLGAEAARVDAGLALGRHAALVPEIEALVAAHPLREGLTAQLMLALYRSGRQADALRAFERTRAALVDELGISPSAELIELEAAVLRQDVEAVAGPVPTRTAAGAAPPAAPTPAAVVAPGAPLPLPAAAATSGRRAAPFVGRDAELDRLVARSTGPDRTRRVLAVNGDPGIGKTRLVSEVATRVHQQGGLVLWGACTDETSSHYRPFVEALRPLAARVAAAVGAPDETDGPPSLGPGGTALARLLPDLAPEGSSNGGGTVGDDRGPLFDAVTELIVLATGGTRTLLVIDDLHWADTSTCALVVHLARAPELEHVVLAVTYRSAEASHPQPAARALADLRRHRLVEQLPLTGLDGAATDALVVALAGDRVADVTQRLHERTEGNPFFVEEFVAHDLERTDDELPVGVVDVVERRLADLDPEHRRILAAAAVLGRTFDTSLLAPIAGVAPAALLDPLDEAVRLHLLVEAAPPVGRFAFAHALLRDGLLEGMTTLRRSHLHLAAADALDALGPPDDLLAERAHHLVAAGSSAAVTRTVLALHAAAERALSVAAYDEAEAACRQALDLVDLALGTPEATDVLLTLAGVRTAIGDADGARKIYRWAADAARARGDGHRLGLAATGMGAGSGIGVPLHLGLVDEERVTWLEEALELLGDGDPAFRTRLLSHLAVALYEGDPRRSERVSREAMAEAEGVRDPTYVSAALIARRLALWNPDADLDERLETGRRAMVEGDAGGDLLWALVTRFGHLSDLMEAADLARYDAVFAEAEAIARPLRQRRWNWLCDLSLGVRHLGEGRFAEAEETMERALAEVGNAHGTMPVHIHISNRIALEHELGRLHESVERLASVADISPRPIFDAALALSLSQSGDRATAEARYAPHAEVGFTDVPRDQLWAMTIAWYGEVAHLLGDAEGAGAVAGLLADRDDRMLCFGGHVAWGLSGRVRGLVLATTGDLDGAVAALDRALAGHRRLGLRPRAARTAIELTAVLDRRGTEADGDRAAVLRAEGAALVAELGMAEPVRPPIP